MKTVAKGTIDDSGLTTRGAHMASQNRRITRVIKGAVKKLKRGEIPFPPAPTMISAAEEEEFWKGMESRRQAIRADLKRLSADSSRAGHKRRLRLDEELVRIEELLNSRS
jgi:hypothetical protein